MKYAYVKDIIRMREVKINYLFFTMVGDLGNVVVVVRACAEVLRPVVHGVATRASSLSTALA